MPQFLILAAAAAAAVAGWRFIRREMDRVDARLEKVRATTTEAIPTLERDPKTGVYRPRDHA